VTSELAFERSGPERFLASFRLFRAMVGAAGDDPDRAWPRRSGASARTC